MIAVVLLKKVFQLDPKALSSLAQPAFDAVFGMIQTLLEESHTGLSFKVIYVIWLYLWRLHLRNVYYALVGTCAGVAELRCLPLASHWSQTQVCMAALV